MNEHTQTNTLADLTVNAVRETSNARSESRAWKELLLHALEMLGARDRELKQVRERYHALLEERRVRPAA